MSKLRNDSVFSFSVIKFEVYQYGTGTVPVFYAVI